MTTAGTPQDGAVIADQRMTTILVSVLRIGAALAATATVLGGLVLLWRHGGEPADYHLFQGVQAGNRTVGDILAGTLTGDPRSLVQLGILLLIATPVMRVMASMVGFVIRRDWAFTFVTSLALVGLLYGLLVAT